MECLQEPVVETAEGVVSDVESKKELSSIVMLREQASALSVGKDKVDLVLSFMRDCIADPVKPRFREFWESKRLFLEFVPECGDESLIVSCGRVCKELSRDALVLKDTLNKQSNFAVEQIELAIDAIKSEVGRPNEIPEDWDSSVLPDFVSPDASFYFDAHSRLLRLSALTDRIVALRGEVLSISMRGRAKKRLLVYLSEVGNVLFPEKRDIAKKLSDKFMEDVKKFEHYASESVEKPKNTSFLLSEIRKFQALAKELHLTRQIFRNARTILSGCWDKVSAASKNKRTKSTVDRDLSQEKYDLFNAILSESISAYNSGQITEDVLDSKLHQVQKDMRTVDLSGDHLRALKRMIKEAKGKVFDAREQDADKRREEERQAQLNREKTLSELKSNLSSLLSDVVDMDIGQAESLYDQMCSSCHSKSLWKSERIIVDKLLKQIKSTIDDKRRAQLIASSDFDQDSTDSLKDKLMQLYACREEVKNRLMSNKKSVGSSGLDFEKAIYLSEIIENDKNRLNDLKKVISSLELTLRERGAI